MLSFQAASIIASCVRTEYPLASVTMQQPSKTVNRQVRRASKLPARRLVTFINQFSIGAATAWETRRRKRPRFVRITQMLWFPASAEGSVPANWFLADERASVLGPSRCLFRSDVTAFTVAR